MFALKEISTAITSFEANPNGYVSQAFLEGEVTEGFDKSGREASQLTDEANQIINQVSELVWVPSIDESEVMNDVRQGKKQANEIIEELVALDNEGSSRLEFTQDNLQTMQTFLSEMSGKLLGSTSISNYNVNFTRGMSAYKTLMDEVYNKNGTISESDEKLDNMTMAEIEKIHEKELARLSLDKEQEKVLNRILREYKSGNINLQFYSLLMKEYWYVNTKLDTFFKGIKFVLYRA